MAESAPGTTGQCAVGLPCALIVLNAPSFLLLLSLGKQAEALVTALGVVPPWLLNHPSLANLVTIFTSMFPHGGWAHLC